MKMLLLSILAMIALSGFNNSSVVENHNIEIFTSSANGLYYKPNVNYVFRSIVDEQNNLVVELTVKYDELGVASITADTVAKDTNDFVALHHLNTWSDLQAQFFGVNKAEINILNNQHNFWLIPFGNPTNFSLIPSGSTITLTCDCVSEAETCAISWSSTGEDTGSYKCVSNQTKICCSINVTKAGNKGGLLIKAKEIIFQS